MARFCSWEPRSSTSTDASLYRDEQYLAGALSMYLTYINLFIFILRLIIVLNGGGRRVEFHRLNSMPECPVDPRLLSRGQPSATA